MWLVGTQVLESSSIATLEHQQEAQPKEKTSSQAFHYTMQTSQTEAQPTAPQSSPPTIVLLTSMSTPFLVTPYMNYIPY